MGLCVYAYLQSPEKKMKRDPIAGVLLRYKECCMYNKLRLTAQRPLVCFTKEILKILYLYTKQEIKPNYDKTNFIKKYQSC